MTLSLFTRFFLHTHFITHTHSERQPLSLINLISHPGGFCGQSARRTTWPVSGSCKALVKRDSKVLWRAELAPLKAGPSLSSPLPHPSSPSSTPMPGWCHYRSLWRAIWRVSYHWQVQSLAGSPMRIHDFEAIGLKLQIILFRLPLLYLQL